MLDRLEACPTLECIMVDNGIFRRRHLPHWDVEGHPFFITGCLHGSLPAAGLKRFRQYQDELQARPRPAGMSESEWEHRKQKLLFAFVDDLLDQKSPVEHLRDERQAAIVQNAFPRFAGERYTLLAFVVMPSHHHWMFLPNPDWAVKAVQESVRAGKRRTPREIISHGIQSYTATMCNRVRGETGVYWQSETFDHWVRDEAEAFRIIEYIEHNPVKAGLAEQPEDWRYSSANLRAMTGANCGEPLLKPT
jgi:putative transposase